MRSYLSLCQQREKYEAEGKYHPWTIVATNMSRLKNVDRAVGYSQSDLVTLWNGNVRLVWNSLYPIEKGFFKTPPAIAEGGKYRFLRKLLRVATHHKAPIRALMQHLTMRIPTSTIKFINSDDYDYWEFLQDEYAYVCSKSGIETQNEIYIPGVARRLVEKPEKRREKYPDYYQAKGTYQIPKNRAEAIEIASKKDEVMLMALSIEGAHIFGAETENETTVLERIDYMKQEWEHPLFFITYSHHFDNGLCGHAHSLPAAASFVLNQEKAMGAGFTPLGWKAIRKLLAINEQNEEAPEEGYRVLIDLKHMSPRGRQEYYNQIIRPCLANGITIPLIASHCSYSGRKTLDDVIALEAQENDLSRIETEHGHFYAWGINMCAEDIELIYKTGGMFGLCFDKRISGVSPKKKEESVERIDNIQAIWNNIKAILMLIYSKPELTKAEKRKAWDMLAIGTDFDGYIDPISTYKTAVRFPSFKQDLLAIMKQEMNEPNPLPCLADFDDTFTPEVAVDKICYDNTLAFTLKHYPQ